MAFEAFDDLPINWSDHEDVAMKLYEKFGDDFTESKIYRIRFTQLIDWVLEIPTFEGSREDCSEGHLEQIQAKWVYEWRDNQ
ncbi:MAG: Fe-S cluster assembly protein IscX [Bacteroidetes bacterium]|jgi:FeS assembly protein IscX|nr:Fe-S cluster assembly protein IscX [Bacteroidota bacterium]MDF1864288.1 Fe-S cluster assembly protein IscX [Saprospiraceae bacterium]